MSGLDILGGIGKGIMVGNAYLDQRRAAETQNDVARKQLALLEENADYTRGQREIQAAEHSRKEAERARKISMDRLAMDLRKQYPEGGIGYYKALSNAAIETGQARPEELDMLDKQVRELEGTEIGNALLFGDTERFGKVLSSKVGEPLTITAAPGKDAFGNPMPVWTAVGQSGKQYFQMPMDQVGALMGRKEFLDLRKANAESAKTSSEISRNEAQAVNARASAGASSAQAGKYQAEAEEQRLLNAGWKSMTPEQRVAAKSSSSGSEPNDVKIARWWASATDAEKAAFREANGDPVANAVAKAAVDLKSGDITGRMTTDDAVAQARDIQIKARGQQHATGPSPKFEYIPGQGLVPK